MNSLGIVLLLLIIGIQSRQQLAVEAVNHVKREKPVQISLSTALKRGRRPREFPPKNTAISFCDKTSVKRGSYIKPERSRNLSRKMFSVVPGDVLCDPDETFEVFADIDSDVSMSKDAFLALVARSL